MREEHRFFSPSFRAKGKRSNEYGEAHEERICREVTPDESGAGSDRQLVASLQLPVGRHDLPSGQPAAQDPAEGGAREATLARPLGLEPGAIVRLGALEPRDQTRRPRRDLHRGSGPRRARRDRSDLSRWHVHGDLSGQERRRRGIGKALQAVFVSRSHRIALHARDAGIDPRGRRARLQPVACLWSRARQPRAHRRVRDRRRRGGDRAARDGVALEQVPEPRARRRGAPDPASQRLQDREPYDPRADRSRRARGAARRLRLQAVLRRGLRAERHAPGDGGHSRRGRSRRSAASGRARAGKAPRKRRARAGR